MKIHKVTFHNINSLTGTHTVDFDDPSISDRGIFLITGDTGAGKTSILDAITLALYSKTSRLGSINNSNNEVMSKGTGDCGSTVTFSEGNHRYTVFWEQHRAKRKSDGKLQDITWKLAEGERILASSLSETAQKIVELSHLNWDQFTKSVLLAQGQFAAFLKASTDDRSSILGKATDSDTYKRISIAVFQRSKDENEKLDIIDAILSEIILLTPEELKEQVQRKETLTQKGENLKTLLTSLSTQLADWDAYERYQQKKDECGKRESEWKEKQKAYAQDLARYEKWRLLAEATSSHSLLCKDRKEQEEGEREIETSKAEIPLLMEAHQKATETFSNANISKGQWDKEKEGLSKEITDAKVLDGKITLMEKDIERTQSVLSGRKNDLILHREKEKKAQQSLGEAIKTQETASQWMKAHLEDEALATKIEVLKSHQDAMESINKLINGKSEKMTSAKAEESQARAHKEEREKPFREAEANVTKTTMDISTLEKERDGYLGETTLEGLKENKRTLDKAQKAFLEQQSYEEARGMLQDNEPCPLCGSLTHPYAQGNGPKDEGLKATIDKLDNRIRTIEKQEREIAKIQSLLITLTQRQSTTRSEYEQAIHGWETAKGNITHLAQEIQETQERQEKEQQAVLLLLKPYGILSWDDKARKSIDTRITEWERQNAREKDSSMTIKETSTIIRDESERIGEIEKAIHDDEETLRKKQEELSLEKGKRHTLLKGNTIDMMTEMMERKEAAIRKEADKAEEERKAASERLQNASTILEERKRALKTKKENVGKEQARFLSLLREKGIQGEEEYLSSLLSIREQKDYAEEKDELDRIKAAHDELVFQFSRMRETQKPEVGKQELQDKNVEASKEMEEIHIALGQVQERLGNDQKARERRREKQQEYDLQDKTCREWKALSDLIGSREGTKFERFAQNITFARLLQQANGQLSHLSKRYLLCLDDEAPLEFFVHDLYQDDTVRTVKNLSGGESFLVSLSLALALASFSSGKAKVDSLFLDEGFGTLDSETANMAMDALETLRQEGKIIGIISHVEALKSHIQAQIVVSRKPGGGSTLEGSGVS